MLKKFFSDSVFFRPGIGSGLYPVLQPIYFTFLRLDVHDETAAILIFHYVRMRPGRYFSLVFGKNKPVGFLFKENSEDCRYRTRISHKTPTAEA